MATTHLEWFINNYPELVQEMKDAEHNYDNLHINPFHQEGDVWTHTCMVYRAAEQITEGLPRDVAEPVLWSALCHDLGKPRARYPVDETKRVRFSGHEGLSFYMTADVLERAIDDGRLAPRHFTTIMKLVAGHSDLFINTRSEFEVDAIVKKFMYQPEFFEQLCLQVEADHHGRIVCKDKVKEQGLPKTFVETVLPRIREDEGVESIDYSKPRINILIGPPCAGKSTAIRHIGLNQPIVSRDNAVMELGTGSNYNENWDNVDQKEVDKLFEKQMVEALKSGKDFIVDRTNMSKKSRKRFINRTRKTHTSVAWVIMTGYEEIMYRNQNRIGKHIPEAVIEKMMRSLALPYYDEFDVIHYVKGK